MLIFVRAAMMRNRWGNRTYFRPPTRAPKCRAAADGNSRFDERERTEFRFCVAAKMVALTRHAFQLEVLLSEPSLMCGFGHHTTRKILKYRERERHTF